MPGFYIILSSAYRGPRRTPDPLPEGSLALLAPFSTYSKKKFLLFKILMKPLTLMLHCVVLKTQYQSSLLFIQCQIARFNSRVSAWHRSLADNLRIRQEIIWNCCQNDRLFQNKWPKRPTHATYASDTWSSILQFVHNLFWLKLKWNARSKLFYCIIYRFSMLWWSSMTLTKLKSQSQKRFNERKYQYLKYKNKNHSRPDT
jgi:hypothetical protein